MSNGKFCLHCGKPLVGKQSKYCGDVHRQAYNRTNKKTAQPTDEPQPLNASQSALVEVGKLRTDLAESKAMTNVIADERDRLSIQVERSTAQLIEAEKKASVAEGQLKGWQIIAALLGVGLIIVAVILVLSV